MLHRWWAFGLGCVDGGLTGDGNGVVDLVPLDSGPSEPVPTSPAAETFSASFLWAPISFATAVDLGAEVAPIDAPSPPGPAMLTEVTVEAGLGASVVGGNDHGVGVGFFDADGDGWEDLFVANGFKSGTQYTSALWHNDGDGTFTDVSTASGFGPTLANRDNYSVAAVERHRRLVSGDWLMSEVREGSVHLESVGVDLVLAELWTDLDRIPPTP